MWTNGTTVLEWLQSTEKSTVFVANWVAEILEKTTTNEWNYVRTSESPVDAGTRRLSAPVFSENHWLKYPDFLKTVDWLFQTAMEFLLKIKKESVQFLPSSLKTRTTTDNGN